MAQEHDVLRSVEGEVHSNAAPRFGVVIVNYNGADTLNPAIRSALLAGLSENSIVLVDNGSVDASVDMAAAEFPQIQIIRNHCNTGFARAVNRGIERLSSEFVMLLNSDAEIAKDCFDAFAHSFDEDHTLAIAGAQLRYPNGRLQSAFSTLPTLREEIIPMNFLKWASPERYLRVTDSDETRVVESVFGACLAVRMEAIRKVGMLDDAFFFYFEELDWCQCMRQGGWQIKYVPTARALHILGHAAKKFRSGARIELQRSKLRYFRKHTSVAAYLLLSFTLIFRSAVNALSGLIACVATLFLKRRLRENTSAYGRVFLWHLLGRPVTWGLPGKCPKG